MQDYYEIIFSISKSEVKDFFIYQLSENYFESFVETNAVKFSAYISHKNYDKATMEQIIAEAEGLFACKIKYEIKNIQDRNWNAVWEENFTPIVVENKCLIRADFHKIDQKYPYEILINPKMSFGTGHHDTTYLMIHRMLEMELDNTFVLDMGCGTGVLAIFAEIKKAKKIIAIDNNEWAYNNAVENIEINNCSRITPYQGDVEKLKELENFDIILANINRNVLLNDIPEYSAKINKNGKLIISGFFTENNEILTQKANENNFSLIHTKNRNNWSLLEFKKN